MVRAVIPPLCARSLVVAKQQSGLLPEQRRALQRRLAHQPACALFGVEVAFEQPTDINQQQRAAQLAA